MAVANLIGLAEDISTIVDENGVDREMSGDLDINEVVAVVNQLVSGQLSNLTNLGDDPEANEDALRHAMMQACLKALMVGYTAGKESSDLTGDGVVVAVPSEYLEQIAVRALREGAVTMTLVASED